MHRASTTPAKWLPDAEMILSVSRIPIPAFFSSRSGSCSASGREPCRNSAFVSCKTTCWSCLKYCGGAAAAFLEGIGFFFFGEQGHGSDGILIDSMDSGMKVATFRVLLPWRETENWDFLRFQIQSVFPSWDLGYVWLSFSVGMSKSFFSFGFLLWTEQGELLMVWEAQPSLLPCFGKMGDIPPVC